MSNIFKFIVILILVLCSYNTSAQEEHNFYVVDTISLQEPTLFNLSKYDGEFLVEKEFLNKNSDKKRLIKTGEAYIYSNDFYYYLESNKFKSYDYPNNGGCSNDKKIVSYNGLTYSYFTNKPKRFIVCLINAMYYNKKAATADIGKTYYHKDRKNVYYKMVFPLCE